MPESKLAIKSLPDAQVKLAQFSSSISENLECLRQAKDEQYARMKLSLIESWEQKKSVIEEYRQCLLEMPSELRKRKLIKETMMEVDQFESLLTQVSQKLDHMKTQLSEESKLLLKEAQIKAEHLQYTIRSVEAEPIIEKFLRGETILSSKSNIQWARKIGHALFGLAAVWLFVYSGLSQASIWFLTGGFIFWAVTLETARHLNPKINEWVCKKFKPVMRECEKEKINSAIFYIISCVSVYFIFPIEVAVLSVLYLGLGDPVAGVVGVKFGKTKLFEKASLEGTLAGFATCFLVTFVFAGYLFSTTLSGGSLIFFSILAGGTGAVAELSFPNLDDNLVVPFVSAPILFVLMHAFWLI